MYDGLIPVVQAEEDLRSGRCNTPEQLGAAVATTSGDPLAGQIAEAKARLARARQEKGF